MDIKLLLRDAGAQCRAGAQVCTPRYYTMY
jgi:hypothetical protein